MLNSPFGRHKIWVLCSLIFLASMFSSSYLFAAGNIKKVTEIEGISEYRLDNGLQVLLFPDQTKETVTVNITYHVGSKHENYGETGMAHLLEHLVFKGSPKHKNIPAELSSHGARPNGTTWTDRTNYFETFAATQENILWALDMEADRMVNSFIAKKDLDSEMTVVRNEFERGENSPFNVTLQRMMASAFEWHNYGKDTIGAKADLENVPIDRLQAFYKKYYQPDNATLIVAGKFTEEKMLYLVNRSFGSIPKPTRKLQTLYTQEPAQDGEKQVTVRRVGDIQLMGSLYHIPSGAHPEFASINVLTEILGATSRGRLHKAVVEKKLASQIFGFNFQWQEPGVAIFMAQVDKETDLTKTQKQLLSTIENLADNPITDEEVERAKRTLMKKIELSFNSSERIALNLSEWLGMGDWRLLFLNRDRIENVITADVQKVANKYFVKNNRTAGRFIPTETVTKVEIPQVGSVAEMLKGYKGRKQISQGEAFDPSHDNIDQRTTTNTLGNGVKLSLLPKKTRGESVAVRFSLQMGDESSLSNKSIAAKAAASMLMKGTKNYNREQLKDEFDKLKANVQVGGDSQSAFVTIETTQTNLLATLALVSEVLQKPAFDKKEFSLYKNAYKVDLEGMLQDPQTIVFREFSRHQNPYPKNHPNYVTTIAEEIEALKKLSLRQVKSFHKKFYSANSMQVSIVGDFDQQKTTQELEHLFGDWKSNQPYTRITKKYQKLSIKNQTFNTPDKENAGFVASTSLPIGDNHPDAPALQLGNYIFGGGFLNSRLAKRLRQKDGLSYGAGSFLKLSPTDNRASMGAYAICAPQNLAKVEKGFKEELIRLLDEGFTNEEIANAKSGLLQSKKVSRSQDKELVDKLSLNSYLGRTMQQDKQFEEALASLSAVDVHKVMKKYLSVDNFSILKGGDMNKIELTQ